jgi:hypothetical protein
LPVVLITFFVVRFWIRLEPVAGALLHPARSSANGQRSSPG